MTAISELKPVPADWQCPGCGCGLYWDDDDGRVCQDCGLVSETDHEQDETG